MPAEHLTATVARLAGCAPGAVEIRSRAPLEHQSNRLYEAWADGRHLIVKEYLKPEELSTAPVQEHRSLEVLAPLDVAPQPVGVDLEHGAERGPIVVYEYLDGEMWGRRKPSEDDLRALAEVWLAVDALSARVDWSARGADNAVLTRYGRFSDRLRSFRAWTEVAFPAGTAAARRCLDLLERRRPEAEELDGLDRQPMRRSFSQADSRFANVIRRPDGRIGLVDWEDAGLGDPARDVVGMISHPEQEDLLGPEAWQAFLDPYLAAMTPRDPLLRAPDRAVLGDRPAVLAVRPLPGGAPPGGAGRTGRLDDQRAAARRASAAVPGARAGLAGRGVRAGAGCGGGADVLSDRLSDGLRCSSRGSF